MTEEELLQAIDEVVGPAETEEERAKRKAHIESVKIRAEEKHKASGQGLPT